MVRHRNPRHELFAQALAAGKSRPEAMIAAGYKPHRGNQNRMARIPDVVARVEEIRRYGDEVIDLRKIDRPRVLIELARIACADVPLRAAIAQAGPDALDAAVPSVLLVDVRLEGALAKHLEMRLLDVRGTLSALLRYDNSPDRRQEMDFSPAVPPDFSELETVLRGLLTDRELNPSNQLHDFAQP